MEVFVQKLSQSSLIAKMWEDIELREAKIGNRHAIGSEDTLRYSPYGTVRTLRGITVCSVRVWYFTVPNGHRYLLYALVVLSTAS